jgi:2-desacetyl-2-hydroxyethyl bacteriochlorophyllide A dehydrogenase
VNVAKPFVDALKRSVTSRIPTDIGEFQLCLYVSHKDEKEHIALIMGKVKGKSNILVRIHSECFTGEVLGSCRCDCKEQLHLAMQKIAEEGCGILIYLRQEGRGIGLSDKLRAYNLQDQGYDTVDANLLLGHQADERDYTIAALILEDLQVRSVRLLTNNPLKIKSLRELGIIVERQLPLHPTVNEGNFRYLLTKALRMNHLLNLYSTVHREENLAESTGPQVDTIAEVRANARRLSEKKAVSNRTSLYFADRRQVIVRKEELPKIDANQVLVKTQLSAISPGTESLIYRGELPEEISIDASIPGLSSTLVYPLKYGYSAVGQVIAIGEEVDSTWEGHYVMAFHPHESHFIADPNMLLPLPEGITLEDAVFLPNMETAVNFVMDGKPLIGENVVVFGQGIVGLLTTSLLATLPLSNLVTLDCHSLRREASREVGALVSLIPEEADLQKLSEEFLPNGADLTYEISGSPAALDQAILATGFAGRIVIGSWYGSKRPNVDLGGRFHRSRIQLISSQVSSIAPEFNGRWTKKRRFDVAWEMIRQLKPSRFITHRFSINQAVRAYQLLDQNPAEVIQVILTYDE